MTTRARVSGTAPTEPEPEPGGYRSGYGGSGQSRWRDQEHPLASSQEDTSLALDGIDELHPPSGRFREAIERELLREHGLIEDERQ